MKKETKKVKPYVRRGLVQSRVNNAEFQIILTNATVYTKGDVSKFVRLACLNYKPVTKKLVGK